MNNYINLLGSEQVQRAGHEIQSAASEMTRAANTIDSAVQDLKRSMEDWLIRIENLATSQRPTEGDD